MSAQTISVNINGHQQDLHVEQNAYNGKPAYYVTDKGLSEMSGGELPDDLILFNSGEGVQCCPKVISMEGRKMTEDIWTAIKGQGGDSGTPQPFGEGLG